MSGIQNGMDALDLKQVVSHFAQIHADAWKQASKTNAETANKIIATGMDEALSREEALNLADVALRYMRRYL
jgi:hypothetical protein